MTDEITKEEQEAKDDAEYEATAKALDNAIEKGDDLVETMQGLEKAEEKSDESEEKSDDESKDDEKSDDDDEKSEESEDGSDEEESDKEDDSDEESDDTTEPGPELSALKTQLEQTQQALANTQKSQKDTKAWGTKLAQRLKALEKEAKEKPENRPEILDEIEGLEDAIKFMTGKKEIVEDDDDLDLDFEPEQTAPTWVDQVNTAIPDLNELLNDPVLATTVTAKRTELGDQWDNPIIAIRELNTLRNDYLSQKSSADTQSRIDKAVDAALKADKKARKNKSGMKVPGGKGGEANTKKAPDYLNDADAIDNLSPEDFDAMTRRAKGY